MLELLPNVILYFYNSLTPHLRINLEVISSRASLTSEPADGDRVGAVMDPLWRMRADVGLRGRIGHWVITDPCCQVDVKSFGVDDPICVHQTVSGELKRHNFSVITEAPHCHFYYILGKEKIL